MNDRSIYYKGRCTCVGQIGKSSAPFSLSEIMIEVPQRVRSTLNKMPFSSVGAAASWNRGQLPLWPSHPLILVLYRRSEDGESGEKNIKKILDSTDTTRGTFVLSTGTSHCSRECCFSAEPSSKGGVLEHRRSSERNISMYTPLTHL